MWPFWAGKTFSIDYHFCSNRTLSTKSLPNTINHSFRTFFAEISGGVIESWELTNRLASVHNFIHIIVLWARGAFAFICIKDLLLLAFHTFKQCGIPIPRKEAFLADEAIIIRGFRRTNTTLWLFVIWWSSQTYRQAGLLFYIPEGSFLARWQNTLAIFQYSIRSAFTALKYVEIVICSFRTGVTSSINHPGSSFWTNCALFGLNTVNHILWAVLAFVCGLVPMPWQIAW